MKDKATEKMEELKQQASQVSDDLQHKAGEVWDEVKSGKLKEEATEKIDELKDEAIIFLKKAATLKGDTKWNVLLKEFESA